MYFCSKCSVGSRSGEQSRAFIIFISCCISVMGHAWWCFDMRMKLKCAKLTYIQACVSSKCHVSEEGISNFPLEIEIIYKTVDTLKRAGIFE